MAVKRPIRCYPVLKLSQTDVRSEEVETQQVSMSTELLMHYHLDLELQFKEYTCAFVTWPIQKEYLTKATKGK